MAYKSQVYVIKHWVLVALSALNLDVTVALMVLMLGLGCAPQNTEIGPADSAMTDNSSNDGGNTDNGGTGSGGNGSGAGGTGATTVAGPAAFSFTDTTGAALGVEVTSNSVTLNGFTGLVSAACVGCSQILRNGVPNGNTAAFLPGDTIALRLVSDTSPSAAKTAHVVVGGTTSGTWTVTTTDNTPTSFSFTNQTGVNTSAPITSNTVTLGGTFTNVTATCGAGCIGISRNGAAFSAGPVNGFNSGDTIAIKQTSSSSSNSSTTATVTVGSTTSTAWQVTTTNDACANGGVTVGTVCADGTIYAGLSPDGNVRMFTTKCDAGLLKGDGSCETDRASNTGVKKNWSSIASTAIGITATSTGRVNTDALYALIGHPNHGNLESVKYCYELIQDGHDDWYLPAKDELDLMYDGRVAIGNFETTSGDYYWSATEYSNIRGWSQRFADGNQIYDDKRNVLWFRCVRSEGAPSAPSGGGSTGPAAFNFAATTNAALSAEVTSNTVTLTGLNSMVFAACVNCTHIIRNGVVNGNTSIFMPGDTIALQMMTAATPNTATYAYVVVGSTTSGTWAATTSNNTPTAFSFTNQTGVNTSAPITSNTVTLGGTFTNVTATCGAGCIGISRNGGAFSAGPVNGFNSGDTIAIKQTSSSSSSTATTATVTVGSTTSTTWQVTTTNDSCANGGVTVGTVCADGTIYAGLSPDGNVRMFTTKCDAGLLKGDGSCETDRASNTGIKKNWSTLDSTHTGITAPSTGRANTDALYALIGHPNHGNFQSVKYCYELVQDGHDDWYLPAKDELDLMYDGRVAIGNFETTSGDSYWSATEYEHSNAWSQQFTDGSQNSYSNKANALWFRCVRSDGAPSAPSGGGSTGPAAFNFAATTSAALSTEVTSNTVTLTGLTSMVFAACVNCTHIIRNGVVNGNTSIFMPGDTIALQMMTAATPNTATYAYVVVGSTTSGTWAATTSNNTPTAFSFTNQTGVNTSAPITSNTVTLGGTFTNVTATCGAGCIGISRNGAAFSAVPVNGFNSGDTIAIKQTSSSSSSSSTTATVTVGSTASTAWQVTTTNDACANGGVTVGTVCADGTIYAGLSPDGNVRMFTTKCDAGLLKGDGSCETDRASNTGVKKNWSSIASTHTGITATSTGRANTDALYALIGHPNHGNFESVKYCYELIQDGHDDWYLPAKDELDLLYDGRVAIGNFETASGDYYWSATDSSTFYACAQRFSDGFQASDLNKHVGFWFRCVRSEGAPSAPSGGGSTGPAAFNFAATTSAALSAEVTSNTVTLTGLTSMVFAACVNCTHIIRNGVVNGSTSIFMPGDTIALQMMTAATPNTSTYAYVVVGSTTSGTWAATTSNNTPTAFSFTNQTGVNTSAPITSNTVTLGGTFTNVTATCGAGCIGISRNGGAFSAGPVNGFNSGDTIAIKQTSSSSSSTATSTTVTVGSTTSTAWQVTTTNDACANGGVAVGTVCADGTIYAGLSPDGNVKMYTTKCDAGLLKGDGSCETDRASNTGVKKNWSSVATSGTGITATSTGRANTDALYALVGHPSHGNFESIKYCYELIQDGHDDWYLPAKDELDLMYDGRVAIGNFETTSGDYYWSATEIFALYAGTQRFTDGSQIDSFKSSALWFRCVRRD